ncbi:uncharacterized protein L201_005711 [Kwoniella dendrophila CBS 6074]|uniref:Arrestin C-terminal-like domain-containing protein n=1 Tax=Kwoniella dendrophila CBS 6074 TaxID=1295534 RepID=A0AAX4K0W4_9TREE
MPNRSSSPSILGPSHAGGPSSSSLNSLNRGRPISRSSSPRPPPSYARSGLDRSPSLNPMVLDNRPRVPTPIYLRCSSPGNSSSKGSLKIHIPAWGVSLVQPPRILDLHPLEAGSNALEPPCEDTVLSGSLEVIMKERRRVKAISVGVQSVCRLNMGKDRVWEEDGIFERGVEVLGPTDINVVEGIWLEKGSQSFSFTIILPATLATTDYHNFGRVSYILTARVEGSGSSGSLSSMFKTSSSGPSLDQSIPDVGVFERVIARSNKVASSSHNFERRGSALDLQGLAIDDPLEDNDAIAVGEGPVSVQGLYTRRQSGDLLRPCERSNTDSNSQSRSGNGPFSSSSRRGSSSSLNQPTNINPFGPEVIACGQGWLKGDLCASKAIVVHANPSRSGGVNTLDLRKEGFVDGLGTWRFSANSDVFAISSVLLLSVRFPAPSPNVTIFMVRLILSQTYSIISPRTPNQSPHMPEGPKQHVIYQVGRPHKPGERYPSREVEALWRGTQVPGKGKKNSKELDGQEGWKIRAVVRLPGHDRIRPSTNEGTITPIRVKHELILQVFYSLDGKCVFNDDIEGPGELRMMSVKMPIAVPSCCLTLNALNLPTYECAQSNTPPTENIDTILSSPSAKDLCMCGSTFAELGEAAMRRMHSIEQDEIDEGVRESQDQQQNGTGSSGNGSSSGSGSASASRNKDNESRRNSFSNNRDRGPPAT